MLISIFTEIIKTKQMKVFKNNQELIDLIKDGQIIIGDSIQCDFDINVKASINAWNIKAWDINADNINAWDINALNIKAWDIKALNIKARDINADNIPAAWDIKADNINAGNINAWNINAQDIKAGNINADNISYYAFCVSSFSITCKSIKGRRENSFHKCLDKEIVITEEKETQKKAELMISEAKKRFPFLDLETIQQVVLYRLEGEIIEGEEINKFYYESVKNWVLS